MELGKLKEVKLREVWKHEQYNFSSWLAEEENINALGQELGLTLIDVETEKFIGGFRCDIVCKDELSGKVVLIENQLEQTNHEHLGKIITYASGMEASVLVWIVESAREEHKSAIEWLNNHTDDNLAFFLIEVHAYKIGDSLPAPQFQIVEKPNNFSKQVKKIVKDGSMNESMGHRLEFWNLLNEKLANNKSGLNIRKATTDHWYNFAIGSSKCHIAIELVNKKNLVRVTMYIDDCKEQYDKFYENKDAIEQNIDYKLTWDRLNGKKASLIYTTINGLNFDDKSNYNFLMQETIKKVVDFKKRFKPYLI